MKPKCTHPPRFLFSWIACADDGVGWTLVVACRQCRKVLKGAAPKTRKARR